MYCQIERLQSFRNILDKGQYDLESLFSELGLAIIKNNLAICHPGFPAETIRRQYEQMIGARVRDRFVPGLGEAVDPCAFDLLGRLYESIAHANGTGKAAGEFYTPPFVVDYMVSLLELETDIRLRGRKFADIACGSGAFLVAAARKVIRQLKEQGVSDAAILRLVAGNFYGFDISRTAVDICKTNLYLVLLDELGPEILTLTGKIDFNVFAANAIDKTTRIPGGFDYILGNPPYLEAKKMPPELKQACRESWPELKGAFDLYVPFVLQCHRLVAKNGKVCLILPDKFTVAQYGIDVREELLKKFSIIELADLSGMDVFGRAMVYPAVIACRNARPASRHTVRTRMSVRNPEELNDRTRYGYVPQGLYRAVGHNKTLFCVPETGDIAGMLQRIFEAGRPVGHFVDFRSAVSFHRKGLREQFVAPSFDGRAGPVFKYLGGKSFTRRNEVAPFRFHWEGYYINYDQAKLKELNNGLPPLSNFRQEKIVLCQHAPRLTAAYDAGGEFVTKDVYPIGIAAPGLAESPLSLKYFTALLNSELMSFVYGTVYKGIQIGGGYYHYLPTWLDILPVVVPERRDIRKVERLADEMTGTGDHDAMRQADDIFYRTYGISGDQRAIIARAVPSWKTADD